MAEDKNLEEKKTVEGKPRRKRGLRKFLKVAVISFSLLLVALFVFYYICLLVITGEMEEDIQKWRNDPDNILNVRINKTPIRYEVDPEIARDLEKFYIGEFEILLPGTGIDQPFVSCFYRKLDKDRPVCEVHPLYKKFGITVFRSYQSVGRIAKLSEFEEDYPAVFWKPAWSGYSEAPLHLQATYKITRFLCDISLQHNVETLENIMSCAPEDIENCNTPWAIFDLASRLSLKDMFVLSGLAVDERDVKAYKIQRCLSDRWTGIVSGVSRAGQENIYYLEIGDEFLALVFWRHGAGEEDSNNSIVATLELEKTILASFKRHDEKDAGQMMYKKAEEILGKPDIKLADKLLGRFYAACALSQEPHNWEYAQTYLATFTLPSEQAMMAYGCISDIFPDNKEIAKKAEELRNWEDENRDYFEDEGDNPEVEYPIVNEGARRAKVDVDIWKKLTPEEQKQVLEAVEQGKTFWDWFHNLPEERKEEID